MAPAAALAALRAADRLLDRLAEHELVAEHAHRLPRRRAHRGHADPMRERADDVARLLAGADEARRDAERPGRGGDQEGIAVAALPSALGDAAELVLDQLVGGLVIGHARQRLGQRHQREALARRQAVGVQEILETADETGPGADVLDEARRQLADLGLRQRRQEGLAEQPLQQRLVRFGERCLELPHRAGGLRSRHQIRHLRRSLPL